MNFDLIAPVYDALSRIIFGRSLVRVQCLFLPQVQPNSSVLIVGGGTGLLLTEVLTQCQPDRVVFLEASAQMMKQAHRRVQHHPLAGRVEFRLGTEAALLPDDVFTVVMLPFVLDLFTGTVLKNHLIPPLRRATALGGRWLVTDFIESPNLYHRLILKTMYCFFRLVSGIEARRLPDWPRLLSEAGLTPGAQQRAVDGQVQTGWWGPVL